MGVVRKLEGVWVGYVVGCASGRLAARFQEVCVGGIRGFLSLKGTGFCICGVFVDMSGVWALDCIGFGDCTWSTCFYFISGLFWDLRLVWSWVVLSVGLDLCNCFWILRINSFVCVFGSILAAWKFGSYLSFVICV